MGFEKPDLLLYGFGFLPSLTFSSLLWFLERRLF